MSQPWGQCGFREVRKDGKCVEDMIEDTVTTWQGSAPNAWMINVCCVSVEQNDPLWSILHTYACPWCCIGSKAKTESLKLKPVDHDYTEIEGFILLALPAEAPTPKTTKDYWDQVPPALTKRSRCISSISLPKMETLNLAMRQTQTEERTQNIWCWTWLWKLKKHLKICPLLRKTKESKQPNASGILD